jgi:hypothetical protein
MPARTVKEWIRDCSLEDLATDKALLRKFAELLKQMKAAGYDPIRVEEVQDSNGITCLEITCLC